MATVHTRQKALEVNLDPRPYGTFAEIGAGQEVVRWFFTVGGAAGTISKSISAYDMRVSDVIYGECERYVSRSRLEAMLNHEHRLNLERLATGRHGSKAFFTFADTVVARNYRGADECHGWMGIRFQARPGEADSQIVLHVRMLDPEAAQQQQALGIVGVNLVYGAFYLSDDLEKLLASLLDGLSIKRIEIDMIEFSGDKFRRADNRVMSLKLVHLGLSKAAMFAPDGKVLQPSEVLYKKPVMVQRGSFRPPTHVHVCMQNCAIEKFGAEPEVRGRSIVSLMEITMSNLMSEGEVSTADFLARADILAAMGKTVLISDYQEYYRLAEYLSRYTHEKIGLALGAGILRELFDEKYYEALDGGILEGFGRLFKHNVKLFVYPMLSQEGTSLVTVGNLETPPDLADLYRHLVGRGYIEALETFDRDLLTIYSQDVLARIRARDPSWEAMVPPEVADRIKTKALFGYLPGRPDPAILDR